MNPDQMTAETPGCNFHSWETLPEDIRRVSEPWRNIIHEYVTNGYGNEEEFYSEDGRGLGNLIQRLLWLIPLAETLQGRPRLRALHPFIHHFLMQLSCQLTSESYFPCFFINAESERLFRVTYQTALPHSTGIEIGRGHAEHIANLLETHPATPAYTP